MRTLRLLLLGLAITALGSSLVGCEDDGPAEETGEAIDEAAEETSDAIEDAADELEDAADKDDGGI